MTQGRQGEPNTPPTIPGFTYLRFLGRGGYSTVYLYEQHMPRREVAVKVMNSDMGDDVAARFESEANLMAKVSTHPAILSVYGAGVSDEGSPFIVMEYCPPPSLGTILQREPLGVSQALSTAVQIAGAVETAHRAGIIHRDIKPANILFTHYRRPVLSDFGISAMSGPKQDGELRGMSVPWAPPEQLVGTDEARPLSDIYSLGATTYAMLSGRSPFDPDGTCKDVYSLSRRIITDPVPRLPRKDAPPSLYNVLATAMEKRPENRYPTALAFARALQQVESELGLPCTTVDLLQEPGESLGRPVAAEGEATRLGVFSKVPDAVVLPEAKDATEQQATQEPDRQAPGRSPLLRRALVLVLTTVVAAGAVLGTILLSRQADGPRPHATFATIAPGKERSLEELPPPRNLTGVLTEDGKVTFTWEPPTQDWADQYLYQEGSSPGASATTSSTSRTTVTVPARTGRTCLQVSSLRKGRTSSPTTACVETP